MVNIIIQSKTGEGKEAMANAIYELLDGKVNSITIEPSIERFYSGIHEGVLDFLDISVMTIDSV